MSKKTKKKKPIERKELPKDKQLEFLKKIVKAIFGYNTKLDFLKWKWEEDQLVLRHVDLDDMIPILNRLENKFYVEVDSDAEIRKGFLGKKEPWSFIEIILWDRKESDQ